MSDRPQFAVPANRIAAAPKWAGPTEPAPGEELFAMPAFTGSEIVTHTLGAALNAGLTAGAARLLIRHVARTRSGQQPRLNDRQWRRKFGRWGWPARCW